MASKFSCAQKIVRASHYTQAQLKSMVIAANFFFSQTFLHGSRRTFLTRLAKKFPFIESLVNSTCLILFPIIQREISSINILIIYVRSCHVTYGYPIIFGRVRKRSVRFVYSLEFGWVREKSDEFGWLSSILKILVSLKVRNKLECNLWKCEVK